jgi:uncharacterized membrane protein
LDDENYNMIKNVFVIAILTLCTCGSAQAATIPSFWCSFTEPFITLNTARNGVIYDDNDANTSFVAQPSVQMRGATTVISGNLKAGESFTVEITRGSGSDGMSEFDYPYVGVLSGAKTVTGGCVKLPSGTHLRQVTGVAENDKLNVRAKPNTTAKIVGQAFPKGYVWLKPGASKNGWAMASVIKHPKSEQGTVTSVQGWVKARFLTVPLGK